MKNLLSYESWKSIRENEGVSKAIYNHLVNFFDTHGAEGSYEEAKKYIASKVDNWNLSKDDYEEIKKECC